MLIIKVSSNVMNNEVPFATVVISHAVMVSNVCSLFSETTDP